LPTGCTRRGRRCARCAFLPFSPLGRGFLAGRFASSNDLPHKDFRRGLPRFQHDALQANLAIVCGVREVARRAGASRAKVALAWVLAQGKHVVPIPGTKTPKFLADNAGAANVVLSAADQAELDACRHRLAYPLLRHPCQPCGDTVRLLISRNCHSYKQPIAVAARDRCNGYQGALSCGDSLSC
jgi:hypothetical protein